MLTLFIIHAKRIKIEKWHFQFNRIIFNFGKPDFEAACAYKHIKRPFYMEQSVRFNRVRLLTIQNPVDHLCAL